VELSEFARALLAADTLEGKLRQVPTAELCDERPSEAERIAAPTRPPELAIAAATEVRVPPLAGMRDRAQRVRILHALANHELQAAELFAWALLAFPSAPTAFRRGLCGILGEEQFHCRLYVERLQAHGVRFGDFPVTGHFWRRIDAVQTPLDFVCTMGLTFENANLDFAQEYAVEARRAGDEETARVLERVHEDEVGHVAFAWRWLQRLKPEQEGEWEAYLSGIAWPLAPGRARGRCFDRRSRLEAGIDADFVDRLEREVARRPNGAPR
jgi:uncharacterized ferritin-like protein (DUF455 family)